MPEKKTTLHYEKKSKELHENKMEQVVYTVVYMPEV